MFLYFGLVWFGLVLTPPHTHTHTHTHAQAVAFHVVLANGSHVELSDASHPFLMRAFRVSVGKLGVITHIRFRIIREVGTVGVGGVGVCMREAGRRRARGLRGGCEGREGGRETAVMRGMGRCVCVLPPSCSCTL